MASVPPPQIGYIPPWEALSESWLTDLEAELRRETCAGHPLHGIPVRFLARGADCDDYLVQELAQGRLAIVHLSWRRESDPRWPCTQFFKDADEFLTQMGADNREYLADSES